MEPIPSPRGYPIIGNVFDIDPERPNQSLAQVFAANGEDRSISLLTLSLISRQGRSLN